MLAEGCVIGSVISQRDMVLGKSPYVFPAYLCMKGLARLRNKAEYILPRYTNVSSVGPRTARPMNCYAYGVLPNTLFMK